MTVAMEAMYRRLPAGQRAPMPPRQITVHAAEAIGLAGRLDDDQRFAASLALHAGYGAGTGLVVYALLHRLPLPRLLGGVLAGVGVYLLGYAGWLPLLRLYPPIPREPAARSAETLACHVVWGAVLGWSAMADPRLTSFQANGDRDRPA
jgi:putative membrane protein